jgi:hypothetical protein
MASEARKSHRSDGSRAPKRADVKPSGALGDNPLASDEILERAFYRAPEKVFEAPTKTKPAHYKVVSISLYTRDIERLEEMVQELKRRGHTKANKSQLIRFALDTVDLDALPRGY